jgi:hypothetical protein
MTRGELASLLGKAEAGQSNVLSCLMWGFENYGRLAPPKPGYAAYDDPIEEVAQALLHLADAAAEAFGFSVPNRPDTDTSSESDPLREAK